MLTSDAPVRRPRVLDARPAAASTLGPAWLHGPPRPARVAAAFDLAAYLLPTDEGEHEVLPLLAPGALVLPGGLRLGSAHDLHGLRLRAGTEVIVGQGRVVAPGGSLAVRRTWRPAPTPVGVPSPAAGSARRTRLSQLVRSLPGLADDLPPALLEALPRLLTPTGPAALVGLGPGLTPAGDDVLCGALLGLRATGDEPARARLEERLAPLLHRTTALSATLLRHAALGYAVPPVVDLLRAWHDGLADDPRLRRHAEDVVAVGHTSGAALLLGLDAVLHHAIPTPKEGPS